MILRLTLVLAIAITGSARDLLIVCCMGSAGVCEMKSGGAPDSGVTAAGCCRSVPDTPPPQGCCSASAEPDPASPKEAASCCDQEQASCPDDDCDAPCMAEPPTGCCSDCICCQPITPPARTAEGVSLHLKYAVPTAMLAPAARLAAHHLSTPAVNSRGPPFDRAHARALLAVWLI